MDLIEAQANEAASCCTHKQEEIDGSNKYGVYNNNYHASKFLIKTFTPIEPADIDLILLYANNYEVADENHPFLERFTTVEQAEDGLRTKVRIADLSLDKSETLIGANDDGRITDRMSCDCNMRCSFSCASRFCV